MVILSKIASYLRARKPLLGDDPRTSEIQRRKQHLLSQREITLLAVSVASANDETPVIELCVNDHKMGRLKMEVPVPKYAGIEYARAIVEKLTLQADYKIRGFWDKRYIHAPEGHYTFVVHELDGVDLTPPWSQQS